ncbi:hypothetical protein FDE76_04300 [Clostridium botulinum]|uniref:Uncharacterized protein n=1 Tax=Clostridium botulinum (strain Eklund 17B / Type B) TaxID=935198 RepID=B2TRF0_CLOBB|nr:hypothetical protein [Clostridium sp. ZBS18]ACD24611.1 hypothetical protein CLL_A2184 [Clostridium botulinum B str. Eklund 17B (NRP)]MBN1052501.1 hypothetical protein [Clostridium botulinum]MBN1055614.1 hypothetical protein [Clostridium botulinum]MBY6976882.1 hypothetical protein [Clostridium botulinum]MBY7002060.1 hypothetical protein [Clostridium botulinum]
MKFIKTLIFTMFFAFTFLYNVNATAIGPISASYKEGVYTISHANEYVLIAKLVTPDSITSLAVVDSQGNQKIFRKFNKAYIPTSEIMLEENDSIIIVGTGEISLNFSK